MQKRTLYIGNLAYTAEEQDLDIAFESFGEIEDIKLMRDRETGRSRGFAFITFENEDEAEAAMAMDGKEVAGRQIRVNHAKERQSNNKRPPNQNNQNNQNRNHNNRNNSNNRGNGNNRSNGNNGNRSNHNNNNHGNRSPNYNQRGNY